MKKSIAMLLTLGAFILTACSDATSSPEYLSLQHQNDSLMQANAEIHNQYDEVISFITEVDADMQRIKSAENFVIQQQNETGEMTLSTRERVKNDIELISNTLQRHRERIAELEKKLKNSNANSAALKKAIEHLNAQIAEKDALIKDLQSSLAERDIRITELDAAVEDLTEKVVDLTQTQAEQSAVISSQDMALNEVRYVYANTKQLKEHNILTGGGLFSKTKVLEEEFDVDFFTKADMRNLTSIFLESKKAKILTKHPIDAYQLVQDEEGFYTLNIIDPEKFWELSRYLVVEIK